MQISEHSRRYYGGTKHAEFQDDVMTIVHERYGSQDTPSEWNLKRGRRPGGTGTGKGTGRSREREGEGE
jgi:hypothetical protein